MMTVLPLAEAQSACDLASLELKSLILLQLRGEDISEHEVTMARRKFVDQRDSRIDCAQRIVGAVITVFLTSH